ncbi:MAG TPA: YceI family protein [Gemmatimonadales bacterium]|nr:YceI family protein [Gemmatimonadales bacterium]
MKFATQLLALGAALAAAAPARAQAPDSGVYRLVPETVILVRVTKTGLLAGLGHEHLIRARAFSGEVVYDSADLAHARVSISVPADSLEVMPASDSADAPKILATMREQVLDVAHHPSIGFVSRSVTTGPQGLSIAGDFTLVGVTRPVTLDASIAVSHDTLRAVSRFTIRQTDFGIHPYAKALGLVKVGDEVTVELTIVGVRTGP